MASGGRNDLHRLINCEYDPHVSASPQSDESSIEFEGFTIHPVKQICYWVLVFLSFGFLWLLARWIPSLYITLNCTPSRLDVATRICAKVCSSEARECKLMFSLLGPLQRVDTCSSRDQ